MTSMTSLPDKGEGLASRDQPCGDAGTHIPRSPEVQSPAGVLSSLTKTQRMYVRDGSFHGDITMVTVRPLLRKGLFYIGVDSPNGQYGFGRLTELGRQVQALMAAREGTRVAAGSEAQAEHREDQQ